MKLLIDILLYFIALLPVNISILFGRFTGWSLEYLFCFRKKVIEEHLDIAFGKEKSPAELLELRHKIYRHFGLLLIEFLRLPNRAEQMEGLTTIHNLDLLKKNQNEGKGVFMLFGHFGHWELAGIALGQNGIKTSPIVKEMKTSAGEYFLKRLRSDNAIETIPRRNSVRKIIKTLEEASVTFFLDQNMTEDEGIFVDFFNKPACTMSGLAILSTRTQAPVLPLFSYRDKDLKHHHIVIGDPIKWEEISDDRTENIKHNTQRYTKIIEDIIRKHPDQWIWMHKRWKTQPNKDL
ncbi:MAG: lysophospholipid acyltransferase family protein [Verrucomicrobiota bacterium]|nr:lysophospholipid acyltransferase family protein [Verrucomicrobiota bacterium]